MHAAREPARGRQGRPPGPRAPRWRRCRIRTQSRLRAPAGRRRRRVEHERRRVDEQRDLACRRAARAAPATGVGDRAPDRAVEDEDAERRRRVERRPLAPLGGLEVAQLLAGQRRDDDAAHAHRPGPRQGLGVDPRADDEDAARPPDVDPARPQLAERVGGQLEAAARGGDPAANAPRSAGPATRSADLGARAGPPSPRRRRATASWSR